MMKNLSVISKFNTILGHSRLQELTFLALIDLICRIGMLDQYFQFTHIDENQKVTFASLHFTVQTEHWYQSYQMDKFGTR